MKKAPASDWLSLGQSQTKAPPAPFQCIADANSKPLQPGDGGGAAGSSFGATVGTGGAAITPLQVPPPSQSQGSDPSVSVTPVLTDNTSAAGTTAAAVAAPAAGPVITDKGTTVGTSSGGGTFHDLLVPGGGGENVALGEFTNFPLYTLDENDGVVLFPGYQQLATLNAPVDLRG